MKHYIRSLVLLVFYFLIGEVVARPGGGGGGGGYSGGHSYGGGYRRGGYYGSGGSLKWTEGEVTVMMCILFGSLFLAVAYIVVLQVRLKRKPGRNLKLLRKQAEKDKAWKPEELQNFATNLYISLQAAWTKRDLLPIKEHLHPALYHNYKSILDRYIRQNRVNRVTDVIVEETSFIYFDDYGNNNRDAFAILLKGTMKDYICTAGFKKTVPSEAFSDALVFNRKNDSWVLFEIMNEPTNYQLAKPGTYIEN